MDFTQGDLNNLQNYFDKIYVLQDDCNERQEVVNKKFANDDKRLEIISCDFKVIKWLVTTVAASSIGALEMSIMELVLK